MGTGGTLIHIRGVIALGLALGLASACMPKVEEDEVVPVATLDSHATNGSSASEMKINLVGTCPEGTYMVRVMIGTLEYSVSNVQASSQNNSGVPIATCTGRVLSIEYPVPNPTQARTISFKVKARLSDGRSSLEWAIRSVNYVPPSPGVPGFAITAVGGLSTLSDGAILRAAGGEAVGGPTILTSAGPSLYSGLYNVLTE